MTMEKEIIDTGAPAGAPFSPAIRAGGFLFLSGQVSKRDPETKKALSSGIKEQTREALEHIKEILEKAGTGVASIVKTTVFMVHIEQFAEMNAAYEQFFKDNGVSGALPTRSTFGVTGLAFPDLIVEIECIATA